jgi:hypothetical protein
VTYLLHLRYPNGTTKTLTFASAQARGLFLITLSAQPIAFRTEDRAAVPSLAPEIWPYASVEIVRADGSVEIVKAEEKS